MTSFDVSADGTAREVLQLLAGSLRDMVGVQDGTGRWILANAALCDWLGSGVSPVGSTSIELADRGHPLAAFLRPTALQDEAVWQAGRTLRGDELWPGTGQPPRHCDVLRVPVFGAGGERQYLLVVRHDVTAMRTLSTKLELAGRMLDHSTNGVLVADANLQVIMVNPSFCETTGYSQEEALQLDPRLLTAGQMDEPERRVLWEQAAAQGRWAGEVWNRRKSGQTFAQQLTLSALQQRSDGAITHYIALMADLSASKAAEARIAALATQDIVTGLPNRVQTALRTAVALDSARTQGGGLALMVIDVDNFKTLNDSLGHVAGDQMLRTVSQRLEAAAGLQAVVGRLGGDEFLVALPGVQNSVEAAGMARTLMEKVGAPLALGDLPMSVSLSIGIALYPGDGDSYDALFGCADAALHPAKQGGRGAYHFATAAMNDAALARLRLEAALRHAIDTQGLRLEYQPLIDFAINRIVGFEALCRWDDTEHGSVPPNVFIPLAEETGLIESLGGWVLHAACAQLRLLHDAGYPHLMMAVNLSARQLQRGVLLQQVEDALVDAGLAPDRLELELTESALLHDNALVTATLRRLKALGVKLSIDDFGTGYSSFSYLRRVKFDKIKIDQSFVHDLIEDPDNAAIVRGIISLGLSLGLDVLAEGVETDAVAHRLRHLHCTSAQGYLFARPQRPEALLQLLAAA